MCNNKDQVLVKLIKIKELIDKVSEDLGQILDMHEETVEALLSLEEEEMPEDRVAEAIKKETVKASG